MDKSHFFTARRWTGRIERIVGNTPTIYGSVLIGNESPETVFVGEDVKINNVFIGDKAPIDAIYVGESLMINNVYVGQTLNVSTVNIRVIEVFPT